jgi:TIR domain-containing protein
LEFDVFISYASKDKVIADAVCARLESAGIRCWIAPRDILPGTSYGQSIVAAIHGAKAMVLVFSSSANASPHIPKEVERAVSRGVTIIPFRIEDVAPGDSLDYFISSVHWLDAINPPLEQHLNELTSTIHKLFAPKIPAGVVSSTLPPFETAAPPTTPSVPRPAQTPHIPPRQATRSSSTSILVGVLVVALIAAITIAVVFSHSGATSNSKDNTVTQPDSSLKTDVNSTPGTSPHTSTGRSSPDAIVGCYAWFNNAAVVIRANGTATGGPFTGHWRLINAAQHTYAISWPPVKETDTLALDQRSLSGKNELGILSSATRISGTSGMVGVWRWSNGVPVTFYSNYIFAVGTIQGQWRAINASGGVYELTWPGPVDGITLSPDGLRVSGMNQYGVAISGSKTSGCS